MQALCWVGETVNKTRCSLFHEVPGLARQLIKRAVTVTWAVLWWGKWKVCFEESNPDSRRGFKGDCQRNCYQKQTGRVRVSQEWNVVLWAGRTASVKAVKSGNVWHFGGSERTEVWPHPPGRSSDVRPENGDQMVRCLYALTEDWTVSRPVNGEPLKTFNKAQFLPSVCVAQQQQVTG